ncbi:UDP-glucose 4-epimerase [Entamoeba marina]
MNQTVLVTGGTGFIGSHTVVELLENGYDIIIIDNLSNSHKSVIQRILQITKAKEERITFYEMDILDYSKLCEIFERHTINFVIHFAALKAVGESVSKPIEYYRNNLTGILNLLQAMQDHNVWKIIFSSSATVYGKPTSIPVNENTPLQKASNPYGQTKVMTEQILTDFANAHQEASVILLRYFNPIGAHKSGLIGEEPLGIPTNLMPIITKVLIGKIDKLQVFGDDYDTRDGTCIRDYIHVVDLAKGHVSSLKKLLQENGIFVYNLGTGEGYTVMEIIYAMEKATGKHINFTIVGRRDGDIPSIYSECKKAEEELNWKASLTLDDMCVDSWRWQTNNIEGF